jgi:hypothetical protein
VGRCLTVEKQLQKDIEAPREFWPEMAQNRTRWRNMAAQCAQRNEDKIIGRLLEAKRRRWCEIARQQNIVNLRLLENAPVLFNEATSVATWPHDRVQTAELLRPFELARRAAGPFQRSI